MTNESPYGTCPACGARVLWMWEGSELKPLDLSSLVRLPADDGRMVDTYLAHAPVCAARRVSS